MIPDNQLARRIQSKRIGSLGVEPPAGDVGGLASHEPGHTFLYSDFDEQLSAYVSDDFKQKKTFCPQKILSIFYFFTIVFVAQII